MDQNFMSRSLWTNDSRFLHHHITDFFTSVQVTQDVPSGTSFGPCVLQNTFYDTIAFIALKSADKREKSYVFRVDPEAMRSSPLVLSWLRLVQAALNPEEQNTEAYLKGGQLYFRTIRHVKQGDELLVWYDLELSHLLGFSDIKTRALADGLSCAKCGQGFKNENPFLAHCRFLCVQAKSDVIRTDNEQKQAEVKRQRKVTDFHNIARDLEHRRCAEDALATRKRKHEEPSSPRSRKPVLLENNNITNHNLTHANKDHHGHDFGDNLPNHELKSGKISASAEIKKPTGAKHEQSSITEDVITQNGSGSGSRYQQDREPDLGLHSDSSAFSCVLPGSTQGEQKSAFCKPTKRKAAEPNPACISHGLSGDVPKGEYGTLLASHLFAAELSSAQMAPAPAPLPVRGAFPLAHAPWSVNGPLHSAGPPASSSSSSSSSLPLLPATFSSLGVSVQNWCAKCNLSFRMTSDLVFHMRSHHKKEFALESQVRKRREEKLTCPICHEYFRERHHLSRHMTSHN